MTVIHGLHVAIDMFFPLKMIYFHSGFTTVGDLPGAGARKAKLQRSGSMGAITMHRS